MSAERLCELPGGSLGSLGSHPPLATEYLLNSDWAGNCLFEPAELRHSKPSPLEFDLAGAYNQRTFFQPHHDGAAAGPLRGETKSMSAELIETLQPDERSVGIVEKQYVTLFEPPNELRAAKGTELGPITVAYETYGTLNARRDNAIFLCHALTGDSHAAGYYTPDDRKPGWWDGFVGPGKGIDTSRYYVICANVLGGCQGTTGPGSINPATGQPYSLTFPVITVGDIVEVHSALVRHLGIERLLSVIGGSLGGFQVLEWAARFPDQLKSAIVIAAGANLSAQGIAFNNVGRRAIYSDLRFKNGQYYGDDAPRSGLALARMLAHITYLSEDSIQQKFGRRLQDSDALAYDLMRETEFQIESYLHYQGERFVARFDANSYLYLTKVMDYFSLAESYGSIARALKRTQARFLVVSYTTDWLFPTSQSRELVRALVENHQHVSFAELQSPYGHDSFLIDVDSLASLVTPFIEETHLAGRS